MWNSIFARGTKLENKIILPIILLQMILIGGVFYILSTLFTNQESLKGNTNSMKEVVRLSNRLVEIQHDIEISVLSYRFNKNPRYIGNIYQKQIEIAEVLDELHPYIKYTPRGEQLINKYISSRNGAETLRMNLIYSIQNNTENEIIRNFNIWSDKSRLLNNSLAELTNYKLSVIDSVLSIFNATFIRLVILTLAILSGTFLTMIFLLVFIRRNITGPISKLSYSASNIAKGKFRMGLAYHSHDEIGLLADSLKDMAKKLKLYYQNLENQVKLQEQQLIKSRELEDRKNEFISAASHELKTPLTSQKIYIQLMQKYLEKKKDKKYKLYINKIDQQSDKLTGLVSDLLDVSKIQAGKLAFKMDNFDFNDFIREIVEDAQESSEKHKIIVSGRIDKEVYGDKERVGQVLSNLISNAIKYSPDSNIINIRLSSARKEAVVCVEDYGIGVEKKHQKKIFRRFYRVTGSNEKTYPGLGMGLYISSEIIKTHGGRIWVESKKGESTKFFFTLPYKSVKI